MKSPDDNDRAQAGTLPADPSTGTIRVKPALRVAAPGEKRQPDEPADIAAEKSLIAALLWTGQNAPESLRVACVDDIIESGKQFYVKALGAVFDAMRACATDGAEHDPVAVHAKMVSTEGAPHVSLEKLRELVVEASTITEAQVRVYAAAVRSTWARRQAMEDARMIMQAARDPTTDAEALLARARAALDAISLRSSTAASTVSIRQSAEALMMRILSGKSEALSTGFRDLDSTLNGGLRRKNTSIIAARTSIGKSLLSARVVENMVDRHPGEAGVYVTLEMPHEDFTARLLSARAGVPLSALRKVELSQSQWAELHVAVAEMCTKGIYFADAPTQTLASIYMLARQRARLLNQDGKRLAVLVIDHIGLVKPSTELLKRGTRAQQVGEISRGMRWLATELDCHVIGLAQIHRDAERQTGSTMPKLHHLKDSGDLEQDADNILILHRERDASGVISRDKPPALAVAKARGDETTKMLLDFDWRTARLSDWSGSESYSDYYE